MDFTAAAGLPLAGLTAVRSLRRAEVGAGDAVLVHAAGAGGVGSFPIRWAQARRVVGTTSEVNHDDLRKLGATPVAYGDGLVERVRQAAPDSLTASVDYIGAAEALGVRKLVDDPHRIVSNVDPRPSPRPAGGTASFRPQAEDLAELSQPVDAGAARIEVQQAFPLSDAARGHGVSRKGHLPGKLILEV